MGDPRIQQSEDCCRTIVVRSPVSATIVEVACGQGPAGAPGSGATLVYAFNERQGWIVPLAGDYAAFYDPIGSAAAVQANLDTHEADLSNPHAVTVEQIGADPSGSAAAVQANLDAHEADLSNPHVVTSAQTGSVPTTDVGASSGVAPLGPDGKVPAEYINVTGLNLKGPWTPVTNTPTLADGTGTPADAYWVTEPGTVDLGSGPQTFAIGDNVVYTSDLIWQLVPGNSPVNSVFSRTGVITAEVDDYAAFYDPIGSADGVQANLDAHEADLANPHAVTKAQVGLGNADNTSDADKPVSTAQQAAIDAVQGNLDTHESATNPHGTMLWKGSWSGGDYLANDVVRDGDWTMIANKTTSDRPAPQPSGAEESSPAEPITFTEQTGTSWILSGARWTFTSGGWLKNMNFWIPSTNSDLQYIGSLVDDVRGIVLAKIDITPTATGWTSFAPGEHLVPTDSVISVILECSNNSDATTFGIEPWAYGGAQNNQQPLAGFWNKRSLQDILRINFTDDDGDDQLTLLRSVQVGDYLAVKQQASSNQETYLVTGVTELTDTFSFDVSLEDSNGAIAVASLCDIEFIRPGVAVVSYSQAINHWLTGQPAWATVEGLLQSTPGNLPVVGNDAFGVRIDFQPGAISPDWDLVSYSGS